MKKFFSKFLKDTRGVVMMEYIILGCFAVAITVVSVLALGNVYCNGLATMGWATLGNTVDAVEQNQGADVDLNNNITKSMEYAFELSNTTADNAGANVHTFVMYR